MKRTKSKSTKQAVNEMTQKKKKELVFFFEKRIKNRTATVYRTHTRQTEDTMSEFERILQYYSYPIDEPFEGQDGESLLSDEGFGHSSSIGISFFVAISVLLTLTIINGLRELVFRTRQIDLCPIFGRFSNQQQQIQRDRDMAEAMQLQMNQESNVNNLEAKEARREYRRAWYVMFMRDYTMVSKLKGRPLVALFVRVNLICNFLAQVCFARR
jgi:hypothetical protein